MNKKITRLAFGAKCGGLTASGLGAFEPTVAAWASSPSSAASARPPNPVLLTRSNSRLESRRFRYEFQCAFIGVNLNSDKQTHSLQLTSCKSSATRKHDDRPDPDSGLSLPGPLAL